MKTKKLAASIASAMMLTTMVIAPLTAGAEGEGTSVNGGTVTFDKYLVMDDDATTPNVTFEYSITQGTAIDADKANDKQAIYAGPEGAKFAADATETNLVTVNNETGKATVTFSPTDTTTPESGDIVDTIKFADATLDNEKYAQKTITIDLSDVTFTEPGIYRYVITETATTAGGITNDSILSRYLDVYVVNSTTTEGALEVGAKVFQIDDSQPSYNTAITKADKKSTGFTNQYNTNNLSFGKTVDGNQASKNKYFKFTVTLTEDTNVNGNDRFAVTGTFDKDPDSVSSISAYDKDTIKAANNVEYVTYSDLKAGKVFYLKHGQDITINGIPEGLGYTIEEVPEDYTPEINVSGDTKNVDDGDIDDVDAATVSDALLEDDTVVAFTNIKGGTIPTGVLTTVAASVGIVAIGLAGIIFGIVNNRKKSEEE